MPDIEEKPITAQPLGRPYSVDGTISIRRANKDEDQRVDYPHLVPGCYRCMPTCRD